MSAPLKITFQFGDGGTHDAGVTEISVSQEVCYDHLWVLIPKSAGLDAAPVYSIEVSDNNVDWVAYDPLTLNAAINQPFDDTHFAATWVRINYDALSNTTGTVKFDLTFKR